MNKTTLEIPRSGDKTLQRISYYMKESSSSGSQRVPPSSVNEIEPADETPLSAYNAMFTQIFQEYLNSLQ